ncbi:hypothetical protein BGW38_002197, partial [Lunasporangiospora selenospora]
ITREIALWMIASRGLTVYVDEKLKDIPKFRYPSFLKSSKLQYDYTPSLKFWTSTLCAQEAHLIDFVVTLGGDGTVLFTSWLFQSIVPPILPFSAGSLGFLTPFPTADYQQTLSTCLDHGVRVNLRMRFSCTIYRCLEHRAAEKSNRKKKKKEDEKGQRRKGARSGRRRRGDHNNNEDEDDEEDDSDEEGAKRALPTVLTTPTETFEILNDLVLDRGPSANLSLLELFGDEQHLTTVQADGIVISTPTGSTAYSLAAGGPLTHPEIPAILISPICPHTLSFRPMLLPDSMELRICVPFDSRSTAWASFDGRGRVELKQGDHIKVTASVYPFPTICSSTQSSDWFHSLSRCLRWNERERQKGFRVVEHGRSKRTRQPSSTSLLSPPGNNKSSPSNIPNENGSLSSIPRAPHAGPGVGSTGSIESLHMESLPSQPQQRLHHGHAHTASSGSSVGSLRVRQSSLRPQHDSSSQRRAGKSTGDYYDQSSPHDTDTMLTCWGTDSSPSSSDEDDDSNSDSDDSGSNSDADSSDGDSDQNCEKIAKKEEAAEDGDGEWEEETSSEDDDDDYDDDMRDPSSVSMSGGELELTGPSEFQGQSLGVWVETEPARTSGRQGSSDSLSRQQQSLLQRPQKLQQKLEQGIMQLDLQQTPSQPPLPEQPIGKAVARPEDPKLTEQNGLQYQRDSDTSGACSSSSSSNGGTSSSRTVGVNECLVGVQNGPTVVPSYIKNRYVATFYGSGDLDPEAITLYQDCCSRLAQLFHINQQEEDSVVLMTGEGMVGLWGGLKSVIPWPFDLSNPQGMAVGSPKYKILCVGNGVYGCGMYDMVQSLRYPNVDVRLVESAWDQPINTVEAVRVIQEWKPDLVTAVHCDTPTGALNSETVCRIGEACAQSDALFYVDAVSSAGAVNVDISGWNIDIGLMGSQKAFSLEPSLAIVTVSKKAWRQIEKVGYTGYDAIYPFKGLRGTFPYTPLWSALDALDLHLKTVYGENCEKTQDVYEQHESVAAYCQHRIRKMGLKLWWDKACDGEFQYMSSPSVTAVCVPESTTWEELDGKLRRHGVIFGGRVGHMGSQAGMDIVRYAMDVLEATVSQLQK